MTTIAANQTKQSAMTEDSSYNLNDPALYINREASLLEFNRRVLDEAKDTSHPLLERIKFVAIFSSNMDEFFMIRVAGLKQLVAAHVSKKTADGLTPTQQLAVIRKKVQVNLQEMQQCFKQLNVEMEEAGIFLHDYRELTKTQQAGADEYFKNEIFPILTPLASDPGRPFPHISNLALNLAIYVRSPSTGRKSFARLKVPNSIPRLVPVLPQRGDTPEVHRFVWVEDLITHNLSDLFPGYEIIDSHYFRITRNADLEIEADEAGDLLEAIEATVRQRHFGFVVRFTVASSIPDSMRSMLAKNFAIGAEDIYESNVPLGLSGLMGLLKIDRPDLKDEPHVPVLHPRLRNIAKANEFFDLIRQGDILLYHPYHSFDPVVDFLRAAARDPQVLAVKQTLYRAGQNSPVVDALMEARENGKQVAALVELKARFDEESNINWAKALERVGIHVLYGFRSLKTHTKICLVIRRDDDGVLRRYVHLSTGNYNANTANIYTDLGLFTCEPNFGTDASDLFNALTGYSNKSDYQKFLVAPLALRKGFQYLINREIAHAQAGKTAKLIFKMNALIDSEFIKHIYLAAQAGVQVEIIARSICGLRPSISGLSDNVQVKSIVGRFLEHTRIYYFHNNGDYEIYLGSADIMTRNLDRRIETLFPIEDPTIKQEVHEVLEISRRDNVKSHLLQSDGSYVKIAPEEDETPYNSQLAAIEWAQNH